MIRIQVSSRSMVPLLCPCLASGRYCGRYKHRLRSRAGLTFLRERAGRNYGLKLVQEMSVKTKHFCERESTSEHDDRASQYSDNSNRTTHLLLNRSSYDDRRPATGTMTTRQERQQLRRARPSLLTVRSDSRYNCHCCSVVHFTGHTTDRENSNLKCGRG
ncbi:hypothetical protein EDB86DRAFT_2401141 [Lactarius hatsudake]|nr:hypothetical protein EDB86DRAFT_2401141 [Lactarius hatsudake]